LIISTLALALAALPAAARAGGGQDSLEYPVKAALLLNFAKFAEWPAGSVQAAGPTVSICILGDDPFRGMLDATVTGRTVAGRAVEIKRFQAVEGTESCNVLFIASSEARLLPLALARVRDSPVLTVGESDEFGKRGGMIRLFVDGNRAAFSISLPPDDASHVRLSSKLLGVARSVSARGNQ
jgi:YfiR/HmsC-like